MKCSIKLISEQRNSLVERRIMPVVKKTAWVLFTAMEAK